MARVTLKPPEPVPVEPSPDDAQRAALARIADGSDTPLVVVGPAGSGKTTAAVAAAADAVRSRRIDPGRVILLAPTRRAAAALRDRVTAAMGTPSAVPPVRTAASWAYAILRSAADAEGAPRPQLVSGAEQDVVLRELLAGHGRGGGRGRRLGGHRPARRAAPAGIPPRAARPADAGLGGGARSGRPRGSREARGSTRMGARGDRVPGVRAGDGVTVASRGPGCPLRPGRGGRGRRGRASRMARVRRASRARSGRSSSSTTPRTSLARPSTARGGGRTRGEGRAVRECGRVGPGVSRGRPELPRHRDRAASRGVGRRARSPRRIAPSGGRPRRRGRVRGGAARDGGGRLGTSGAGAGGRRPTDRDRPRRLRPSTSARTVAARLRALHHGAPDAVPWSRMVVIARSGARLREARSACCWPRTCRANRGETASRSTASPPSCRCSRWRASRWGSRGRRRPPRAS